MKLRQYLFAAYLDLRMLLAGKREKDLPPLRLRNVGEGDFRAIGEELFALLVAHGLRPEDRVLDIGSGIGRVAIPLTRYLTRSYDGFDVTKASIRWCERHITKRHPHFRFAHANIYNSHYNRRGVRAAEYRFPYADASFDFAFATSVFTHLDLESTRHYLAETHRVLRPGGRLVATFFFADGMSPRSGHQFRFDHGPYRLLDERDPGWGIAFERSAIDWSAWTEHTIFPGQWRGDGGETYQDLVVAVK